MNSYHWLRAFLILVLTSALIAAMALPAHAESGCKLCTHGHQGRHAMPAYADLDADGDNAVTAEEFNAFRAARMAARAEAGRKLKNARNAPSFADLDLDGDGILSAGEFAAHRAQCPMSKQRQAEDRE